MKEKKVKVKWDDLSTLEQEVMVKQCTTQAVVNAYLICYKTMEKALNQIKKDCPEYLKITLKVQENMKAETVAYEYNYSEDVIMPVIMRLHEQGRYFDAYCKTLEELCAKNIRMTYIPPKYVTEEMMCINAKNNSQALAYMDRSKVTANVIMAALEYKYEYVTTYLHNYMDLLNDEQLTEILLRTRDAVNIIPSDRWTKDMLYKYLEHHVRSNIPCQIDYSCKIPNELKDKVYWRSLCMLSGYWYSQIPNEKKEEIIIPKLIQATIDFWDRNEGKTTYNGLGWMLESLPEKYITEELQVEVCRRYPPAVKTVLKQSNGKVLKEEFLDKIAAYGNYDFLDWPEDKYLPQKYLDIKNKQFIRSRWGNKEAFCSKEHSLEEWTEYIKHHGEAIDCVPQKYISKELCIEAMRSNGFAALAKIPDLYKTKDFWETVIKERTYYRPVRVPEEYLTKEEVIEFCKAKKLRDDRDLPEKFKTEEVLLHLVSGENIFIERKYQTQAIIDSSLEKAKTEQSKVFILSKSKKEFWRKEMIDKLCCEYAGTIQLKDNLTKEQIDLCVKSFPQNILSAPQWYREQLRNQSELSNEDVMAVSRISETETKNVVIEEPVEYSQISIWDILAS